MKQSIRKVRKFIRLLGKVRDVDTINAAVCLSLRFKEAEYELGMFFAEKDDKRICQIVKVLYFYKEGVVRRNATAMKLYSMTNVQ